MDDVAVPLVIIWAIAVLGVVLVLYPERFTRHSRPVQVGPPHVRARTALAAHLDQWPDDQVEGVVRWQDFASLTKHDVRELLFERGWFYRGQDMDGDGWPLFATRDPRLAESAEPPPSRYALLTAELRAAVGERVLVDMTPYDVLSDEQVAEVAARTGWRTGPLLDGTAPRMELTRADVHGP